MQKSPAPKKGRDLSYRGTTLVDTKKYCSMYVPTCALITEHSGTPLLAMQGPSVGSRVKVQQLLR